MSIKRGGGEGEYATNTSPSYPCFKLRKHLLELEHNLETSRPPLSSRLVDVIFRTNDPNSSWKREVYY